MHDLRAEFPVLERVAYLNAGTNGPIPARATLAAERSLRRQTEEGRQGKPFFDELVARLDVLRSRAARLLGADTEEVALTGSTTDGVNAILAALDFTPDDEILTSDEEHPGILGPLGAVRAEHGSRVRVVPFEDLVEAVGPATRLVATSHVSWRTGRVVDSAGLAATGAQVLLDGAQGLGAVPVDVRALGCDYYAASGQKWLCGPNGTGYLYARGELIRGMRAPWAGYGTVEDPGNALDSPLKADARRLDTGFLAEHQVEWALAAMDVLEEAGMDAVYERSAGLAGRLAEQLRDAGRRVSPRGRSTLVSFEADDPSALVERLAQASFALRDLPGTSYVRASVGAWTTEAELDRLVELVAATA